MSTKTDPLHPVVKDTVSARTDIINLVIYLTTDAPSILGGTR